MPTWALVLMWVVALAFVVGAVVERRRGHKRFRPDEKYGAERAAVETRATMRGQGGQAGLH